VFKEFLTLMGGVHPQTILTDQRRAMEIALKIVMPGTAHLWCRWHVFRDARIELGTIFRKNSTFRDEHLYDDTTLRENISMPILPFQRKIHLYYM